MSPSLQVRAKCDVDHGFPSQLRLPVQNFWTESGTENLWYTIFHYIAQEGRLEAMRLIRDNCSFFLPVLAMTTSISLGMSMRQKPFTVVLFGTAWKLKINMIFQHLLTPKCVRNTKPSLEYEKQEWIQPDAQGHSFQTTWIDIIDQTWAQNLYYSIFLDCRTSKFWEISIFKMLP